MLEAVPDEAHGQGGLEHQASEPPTATPQTCVFGTAQETVLASDGGLRLTVRDAAGPVIGSGGEARVVLTGTGEDPQRVVLTVDGDAWTGSAGAAGAPGDTAVTSVTFRGHTETERVTWGTVPADEAPPRVDAVPDVGHARRAWTWALGPLASVPNCPPSDAVVGDVRPGGHVRIGAAPAFSPRTRIRGSPRRVTSCPGERERWRARPRGNTSPAGWWSRSGPPRAGTVL